MKKDTQIIEVRAEQLADKIESLITEARQKVASVANTAQVYTYYEIGRYIIEDEQGGKVRAEYGKSVLKRVSERLTSNLGKGWSIDTLEKTRRFFLAFSKSATPQRILAGGENSEPVVRKSDVSIKKSEPVVRNLETTENRNQWLRNQRFTLPWSHYLILTHVKNSDARSFYEIEEFRKEK